MIYLLEDDDNIRNFVTYALNNSGLKADGFDVPSEFWKAMAQKAPSMVVLDIMLPEEDGISVLKKLRSRQETKNIPIMMLTARGTEYDKVIGLDSGADDYVSKPFGIMELISRTKALLRRAEASIYDSGNECGNMNKDSNKADKEYRIGELYLNPSKHIIRVKGRNVSLTLKEFQLLCLLVENEGRVMTRDVILQEIWGYEFDGENRTVDVHIRTLRSKLGEAGELVETVRGIGYRIGEAEGARHI